MGEFFHGWRRKIGMVTLLMACVFAAGWVRSISFSDFVSRETDHWHFGAFSGSGVFAIGAIQYPADKKNDKSHLGWNWESETAQWDWNNESDGSAFHLTLGRFYLGFGLWKTDYTFFLRCFVPYWFLIIPLTLISLWLLLSKPRKSAQTKVVEPVPEKLA